MARCSCRAGARRSLAGRGRLADLASGLRSARGGAKVSLVLPTAYTELPRGAAGTLATLGIMAKLAVDAVHDPETGAEFVWWARAIVKRCASKAYLDELDALYRFVRQTVRYRLDPHRLERVQAPYWTLTVDGAGDCDDSSALLAALALAVGHGAILRAVAVDPDRPGSYSHVYPLLGAVVQGEEVWLGADATQKNRPLGWEPPRTRWSAEPLDLIVALP